MAFILQLKKIIDLLPYQWLKVCQDTFNKETMQHLKGVSNTRPKPKPKILSFVRVYPIVS